MTTTVVIIIVVLVLVAAGLFAWSAMRRRALRDRFGPEYDRAVETTSSRTEAERELRERERKHASLELTPLLHRVAGALLGRLGRGPGPVRRRARGRRR